MSKCLVSKPFIFNWKKSLIHLIIVFQQGKAPCLLPEIADDRIITHWDFTQPYYRHNDIFDLHVIYEIILNSCYYSPQPVWLGMGHLFTHFRNFYFKKTVAILEKAYVRGRKWKKIATMAKAGVYGRNKDVAIMARKKQRRCNYGQSRRIWKTLTRCNHGQSRRIWKTQIRCNHGQSRPI